MASRQQKVIVTVRAPRAVVDEVRRIAEREAESESTVIRRLLRAGLAAEHRASAVGAAQ
jgi:hypothetical protein